MRETWRWAAVGVALVLLGVPGRAGEGRPLPEFSVTATDGQTVASSRLVVPGRCLVLYVVPNAASSRSLLQALRKDDPLSRVAVVAAGPREDGLALARSFPELAGARFFADPRRAAFVALGLHGVPAAIGVRDGTIEWTWLGAGGDEAAVRSRLVGWLR
jgi:hypothetical protein